MARISQREARRLRKRVEDLERLEDQRRMGWKSEWPGGVNLVNIIVQPDVYATIKTARRLGHAVVVTHNNENTVQFYALPVSKTS